MYVYVFSEADCERLKAAGFAFVCEDEGIHAYIFDDAGMNLKVPPDVEGVAKQKLTLHGVKRRNDKGGGHNGTKNDAAV